MGFRFFRRTKVLPGVNLNLSKGGPSLSFGRRGARYTLGSRGQRTTVGIPGTGLFYTTTGSGCREPATADAPPDAPGAPPASRLDLNFFERLFVPQREEDLVDGLRALVQGDKDKAAEYLHAAADLADGAFLAGSLAMEREAVDDARMYLRKAWKRRGSLGTLLEKYGVDSTMSLRVTPEVTAHLAPEPRSILLALAEVEQAAGKLGCAADYLNRLIEEDEQDLVARLSLAEIVLDRTPDREDMLKHAVRLCTAEGNTTPVHTTLMLYQACALRLLGLAEAARDTLTKALRRKKGRSAELRRALRYERMLAYEDLGHAGRQRKELEKLYAEDPDYRDVAERLDLA
jgi:tetratricopeptide (TPR) repeat protein